MRGKPVQHRSAVAHRVFYPGAAHPEPAAQPSRGNWCATAQLAFLSFEPDAYSPTQ